MDEYALRLALSFILGGGSVALFTTIAEHRGSRLGGLLLSFPVKVVISLVFIGANEGAAFAAQAAASVPVGIGVNLVFVVATALLVRRLAPWPAVLSALALWLVVGVAAVLAGIADARIALVAWALSATAALALLSRIPSLAGDRRGTAPVFTPWRMLFRAAGAGTVVALSVVLAHVAGPVIGGLASVFPSGWITTMVILTRKHGPDFTGATVRVIAAGSAAPALFGVACAFAFPLVGVARGTLVGLGIALATTLTVGFVLARRDASARNRVDSSQA
ncbi:MAG: DUF3147 family protein [Thermoplasmatota archaeon]